MIGIYKITNNIDGKCYIGQSKDIEARWKKHISVYNNKTAPNYKLYRAMKKYGLSSFRFEIIEECEPEELNSREIYWIQYYDSFFNGYNMTLGGEACNGTNDKEVYQYTLSGKLIKNITLHMKQIVKQVFLLLIFVKCAVEKEKQRVDIIGRI